MNTTHDDNATSWRDLADQLTPEQIARFARFEAGAMQSLHKRQQQPAPAGWVPESAESIARGFLAEARREAECNLNDTLFDVPVPAGMDLEEVDHWEDDGTGTWTRLLHGETRNIEGFDAAVYLTGVQTQDGAVTWSLYVHVEDNHALTSDQLRALAANLVVAADELDRLSAGGAR